MEEKRTYPSQDEVSLESLRAEIDQCDKEIIQLLSRRFAIVQQIGVYKAAHHLPVLDKVREAQVLTNRKRQVSDSGNWVEEIFKVILKQSRQIQTRIKEDFRHDRQ